MVTPRKLILVVDDEVELLRAVNTILGSRGYEVADAATADQAMEQMLERTPDLIVLDLMLPDMSGLDLLARLRTFTKVPIIILSARQSEQDKIQALNTGADDYMTKPFSAGELVARIAALFRRVSGVSASPKMEVGDLEIDFTHRRVTKAGMEVILTPIEYAILSVLASNPDMALTWRQIVDAAWGSDLEAGLPTLRVHISNLRRKIETRPAIPAYILTEPRVGFRFSTRSGRQRTESRQV